MVTGLGTASDTHIVIPSAYNGLKVKSIGDHAFMIFNGLITVTIPDGVTLIRYWSFAYCRGLTDIQYKSTVEEWQAITKESMWDYATWNYTITCTDGTIDKRGNVTYFEA